MSTEQEIDALEDRRYAAMVKADMAALEALVHEAMLYTHSSGVVDTKASWLESMRSGRTRYKSTSTPERRVRVLGDAALVTGKAQFEVELNGQPRTLKLLYLNVWSKTPEGWKFAGWQSTPQPA